MQAVIAVLVVISMLPAGLHAAPVELRPETRAAYDRYVKLTEARLDSELAPGKPFFWIDVLPEGQRKAAYAQLRSGAVLMQQLQTLDHGQQVLCPNGMIHHWVGIVFIPGTTLEKTLSMLEDYDHAVNHFSSEVQRSKLLAHQGDEYKVYFRFLKKKVITVVLDTEHDVRYTRLTATRAESRSYSARIAEVENPGKPDERLKPVGDDGGFLWAIDAFWRFEEKDGGVYVQSESVSLTRDIPGIVEWFVKPFVTGIPKESLQFMLGATRKALAPDGAPAK
jgi:hypothetical protein